MSGTNGRQRGGWPLWVGLACLAVFALLGLYFYWSRPTFASDPQLAEELSQADLIDEPLPATDAWPQWRGMRRDGISGATSLRTEWPSEGLPRIWRVPLSGGQSSPVVADGRVVTMTQDGDNELVLCFDAATRQEKWRFSYPAKFSLPGQVSGPCSTPCIAGGRVFTVGATGLMHCLDAESGRQVWERDLLKDFGAANLRWGTTFSPLVDGNLVFTNPGGSKGSIVALSAESGAMIWKALDEPAGYSSPIMATIGGVRQVVFFTARGLVALQPVDGKVLWSFPWQTQHDVNAATPLWIRARAGERELDYFFISSGYGKGCGLVKVELAGDGSFHSGLVYAGNQLKSHFSSPVRIGGEIYGFDDPGSLTCLDVKTGQVQWKEGGFRRGSLLVAAGQLLVLGDDGRLVLVQPSAEGYQQKALWEALSGKSWSTPALVGNQLFLRDETEMLCVGLGPQ